MTRDILQTVTRLLHDAFSRTDAASRAASVIIYDFDIVHLLMQYELNDNMMIITKTIIIIVMFSRHR